MLIKPLFKSVGVEFTFSTIEKCELSWAYSFGFEINLSDLSLLQIKFLLDNQ